MSSVGIGSVVMVPFARREVLGVVVDLAEKSDLPLERLATPLRALEADVPPELVRLGLWVGEEYCSTPARGLALVLPPGTGTGAKQRARPRMALTASITGDGRAALESGERLGTAQRRVLETLAAAPMPAADACRAAGCTHDTLRRLEARGLVAVEDVRIHRAPVTAAIGAVADAG